MTLKGILKRGEKEIKAFLKVDKWGKVMLMSTVGVRWNRFMMVRQFGFKRS